jgi:phosphatidate cytidylyltransferase
VASGVFYGALLGGVVLWGGELGLAVLLSALGALAGWELHRMTRRGRRLLAEFAGITAIVLMPLSVALLGLSGLLAVVSALTVAAFSWHVYATGMRLADTAVVVLGALVIGFSLAHLVAVRALDNGVVLTLTVLVSVWAGDVLAYFVGSLIGSHKLAPRISPNKSWEGFAAGMVGTLAVWFALPLVAETGLSHRWLGVIAVGIALAGLVGDLFESRIKREAGVKDSGSLMPGHGGMLDRIDSLLLVSIVAYHLLVMAGAA